MEYAPGYLQGDYLLTLFDEVRNIRNTEGDGYLLIYQ